MNLQSLRPAGEFALKGAFKSLIYGPPGGKKTPTINTCPRPLLLACEAGLKSMAGSTVPTWKAFEPKAIDEFFSWFFGSNERKNFDTLCIDSASQLADIYLQAGLKGNKHGKAAYGEMLTKVMDHLRPLYFTEDIHTYVVCKETSRDNMKWPYFPGAALESEVPHLFDFILHLAIQNVPGVGQVTAFRCNPAIDVLARSRSGNLSDFEPPDINSIIKKAMS